jgi:hypothetical protein
VPHTAFAVFVHAVETKPLGAWHVVQAAQGLLGTLL